MMSLYEVHHISVTSETFDGLNHPLSMNSVSQSAFLCVALHQTLDDRRFVKQQLLVWSEKVEPDSCPRSLSLSLLRPEISLICDGTFKELRKKA